MSDYKVRDFYSPEAVRQVETTNALQAQLEMKYKQLKASLEAQEGLQPDIVALALDGYKRALDDLTHVAGTTLAHLYGEEKWGKKQEPLPEVVDDPAYEYGVSAYDDEKPTIIRGRLSEVLRIQAEWRKNHEGGNAIFRRKRSERLELQEQLALGSKCREETTIKPGPWVKL
jgi:hypothetical protein